MRLLTKPWASALLAVVVGAAAWLGVGPRPPSLDSTAPPGDAAQAALADRLLEVLGGPDGHGAAAVAWVEDGRTTTTGIGADGSTPFEIGSVTKGLTGLLLADAVERGEVRLDQPVGEFGGATRLASTGSATLQELATHRSGLPRLAPGPGPLASSVWSSATGADPYSGSPRDVLEAAGGAEAPGGADRAYSNLGYAVLGAALAEATGTAYPDLLQQRLVGPLGLTGTAVVTDPARLPAGAARGVSANGLAQEPWVADGWAPAGVGTWSTATDLGALAAALLDGSAPGTSALDPLVDDGEGRSTGLGWVTTAADPATGTPEITWHNGGTGGFRSFVGLDRAGGRAVVVLATGTDDDVDRAGVRLLSEEAR